jgi:3',5'-cyclic-nucleotide phosphodiesterase
VAVMDYAACNIVYVDRTAPEDKLVRRDDLVLDESGLDIATIANDGALTPRASSPVDSNVRILLSTFSEGRSDLGFNSYYLINDQL